MTFLQPWMLAALPLVSLPIIIHLLNQRRFQTVPWAAMMFLLAAKALSRGYSRLRHWLIMALRMLAVAAVILAVGRPLSRGWLALAGGRPDTALVILDRSPSMQQRDAAAAESKLATGRAQLASSLATLGAGRVVLLTDPAVRPIELAGPASLTDLPSAGPEAAAADLPALLQAAYDHIRENAAGVSEIWICSDQRANDWAVDAGAWNGLREGFLRLPQQVRLQLLSYAAPAAADLAVRVTAARLERRGEERLLSLSVEVTRQAAGERTTAPLAIEIGGVASTVDLELIGTRAVLADHTIPLAAAAEPRGWGRVALPPDANPANDDFYFVFDEPAVRKAVIAAEDPAARRVLELVAGIPPDKGRQAVVEAIDPRTLGPRALDDAAVLLWQADLPEGEAATAVQAFVDRGGEVIFLPPAAPGSQAFAGVSWAGWTDHARPVRPQSWRTEQDLLQDTLSGGKLPVGDLEIRRSCRIAGEHVPLATLPAADNGGVGESLVGRVAVPRGGIVMLATDPTAGGSSLARDGVVLYCLVQRAIDRGGAALATARQLDAGAVDEPAARDGSPWKRLAGDAAGDAPGRQAGVFERSGRLVAVNRPALEDTAAVVADGRIDELFRGLSYARIAGQAGITDSLVQEIWRAFLIAMLLALLAEGLLCLPGRSAGGQAAARPLEAAA